MLTGSKRKYRFRQRYVSFKKLAEIAVFFNTRVSKKATMPWFCSSFESSGSSNDVDSRNGIMKLKRKVVKFSSQKLLDELGSGDDCEMIQKSKKPWKRASCTSDQEPSACSFIDQCSPQIADHLAVNPRKINEVKQWMQKKRGRRRGCKLLLLTGPTGSGKTATVRVLCEELELELIEWNSPECCELFYNPEGDEVIFEENQVQSFSKFLKSADRGSIEQSALQKVVLVEQLPNIFYREPSMLHGTLRNCINGTVCMYIFIMSDTDSCWYLNPKRILPANIRIQLGFDHIAFNASAITFLSKTLRRITSQLNITASALQIKQIAESSKGDIRAAINNLQLSIDEDKRIINILPLHSSALVDSFHCLGKLLYAKRCDKADNNWKTAEGFLKIKHHARDCPPKDDISELLDKTGMDGDMLIMFLHEHVPNFAPSLLSLSCILNNISLLDSTFSHWEVRKDSNINWYASEVVARSTVFYNYTRKRKHEKGIYHFHKPQCCEEDFQVYSKKKEMQSTFPFHPFEELLSLTLPMIKVIRSRTLNYQPCRTAINLTALDASFLFARQSGSAVLYDDDNEQFDIEEIDL